MTINSELRDTCHLWALSKLLKSCAFDLFLVLVTPCLEWSESQLKKFKKLSLSGISLSGHLLPPMLASPGVTPARNFSQVPVK